MSRDSLDMLVSLFQHTVLKVVATLNEANTINEAITLNEAMATGMDTITTLLRLNLVLHMDTDTTLSFTQSDGLVTIAVLPRSGPSKKRVPTREHAQLDMEWSIGSDHIQILLTIVINDIR